MQKITSRDNPKLKSARKVREGREGGLIFVEGLRLAEEVLRSDCEIKEVFYNGQFAASKSGKTLLNKIQPKYLSEVSESLFNSLSDTKNSQGIVVICAKPETGRHWIEKKLSSGERDFPLAVLLHEINNPSNLGAILRTSEAVGISGVILTKNSADAFAPKALRASMGAAMRVPIWTNADFFDVLDWAKSRNLASVCADVNSAKKYTEIDWKIPRLLIFGSEAHGLTAAQREKVDEGLIIPMKNEVESLNLAVACGVILYEANRQTGYF